MRFVLIICLLTSSLSMEAQVIPGAVLEAMDSFAIDWHQLESAAQGVKIYSPEPAFEQSFAMGIHVPREKYRVLVFFDEVVEPQIPHIKATLKANHFAKNIEDSYVAIHTLTEEGLEDYGADWGGIYYFKPKIELSNYQECQLVCLYKTDVGAVYLLYFFDDFVPDVEDMIWNPVFLEKENVE